MRKNNKQRSLARRILTWYKRQGRTLPWRNISDPYCILISEIMLQQTQVHRVLQKFPLFLRRFPTLRSLAAAQQKDVVLVWQGMGYNNRAVRLHACAQTIVKNHKGRIPQEYDSLIALPGIGKYTANAMLSSAFGRHVPIVDINVQRVLSRVFWRMESTGALCDTREAWNIAGTVLPDRNAYQWNQALMDFGASLCTARDPKCDTCPVASLCASRSFMKRERRIHPKREPSLAGIPNRMYRGRIIEYLRHRNGTRSIRLDLLGPALYPQFSKRHEPWLKKLLADLEKDKLITVKGNGSLRTSRVSLA